MGVNVLEGVRCPECGNEDSFAVSFDVRVIGVMVNDDGYSLDEALSTVDDLFGESSVWTCNDCGNTGGGPE